MKRRYKLLLIILIGGILAIIINFMTVENKTSLVAIGDGVPLGITAYNMVGYSYNDYLSEYYCNKNNCQDYNNEFAIEHLTIAELNEFLEDNTVGTKSKTPIKQVIAKGDILTINIGMDEFIDLSIKNKLNNNYIEKYLSEYSSFVQNIRSFYDKDIIIIGLYSAYNFDKNMVYEINKKLQTIAGENNAKFLDITALALNHEYYTNNTSYYMNYKGHKAIYENLRKIL